MSNFDEKAANWDDNPDHFERALKLATLMHTHVDLTEVKKAMEYGSGTGLLSFALKDSIPEITLMDASEKMTEAALAKVKAQGITNLHPLQYDFMDQPLPDVTYDLIYILQTLHHIDDTDGFLNKSYQLLSPGGLLILIDLDKEDGDFHEDDFHGHKGFERKVLEAQLKKASFKPIHYSICHTITKELEDGTTKEFPLFMMAGRKV